MTTTASAPAWRTTALAQNFGQLWIDLALPGAAARITLHTDGTPDATLNTTAYHLGATAKGSKLMIKSTMSKFYADEFRGPIVTNVDAVAAGISCELLAITNLVGMAKMLPGVGTYATTSSSFAEVRIGSKAIAYTCSALIFPLIEDTAKFGIFNLYSSANDAGVEWSQSRKELGSTPISLVGYELTTRAATDTLMNFWKQLTSADPTA